MDQGQIRFYENKYYMLSNFSSHAVGYENMLYMTAEHAYQSAKFENQDIKKEVQQARSSFRAKAVSHKHEERFQKQNWNDIKISVMEAILRCKLDQHEDVREALIQSGDAEIVENSQDDYFWGCGTDGTGRNEMGKVWMHIREELASHKS